MSQQGVNVFTALPVKNNLFDLNDRFIFLFGADTANTTNSVAQTPSITAVNLFQNSALIIAANTISAQTVTANSFVANNIIANSFNDFFNLPSTVLPFTLSAAQIANCQANAVTIIPAAGANTLILPVAIFAYSLIGNPWNANGGQLAMWYGSPLPGNINQFDDGIIDGCLTTNNAFEAIATQATGIIESSVNAPILFSSNGTGGAPTSGNVSVSGIIQYIVLENLPL